MDLLREILCRAIPRRPSILYHFIATVAMFEDIPGAVEEWCRALEGRGYPVLPPRLCLTATKYLHFDAFWLWGRIPVAALALKIPARRFNYGCPLREPLAPGEQYAVAPYQAEFYVPPHILIKPKHIVAVHILHDDAEDACRKLAKICNASLYDGIDLNRELALEFHALSWVYLSICKDAREKKTPVWRYKMYWDLLEIVREILGPYPTCLPRGEELADTCVVYANPPEGFPYLTWDEMQRVLRLAETIAREYTREFHIAWD